MHVNRPFLCSPFLRNMVNAEAHKFTLKTQSQSRQIINLLFSQKRLIERSSEQALVIAHAIGGSNDVIAV